ncbi:TonB-dependent receptor domain-containing protein [Chitinophagaceae bacterium MMS25-I14]
MRRYLLFSLFLTVFISSVATLHAAVIKGLVSEQGSGEPLVGVPVILEGTSYYAVTGLDGSYTISNIAAGNYKLSAKYASYGDWSRNITLKPEDQERVDIVLKVKSSELHAVEVKAKHINGSDEQARYKEKNADEMMNAISARSIQLLPDITVANVLQRVSGVTVQRDQSGEGRYAIIRGMDKRYNTTLVNGIKIPSPDDKARYVPMDIFPAEIIDRLEVIKALTPNMEGDAIGGVMNLVMKDAPDHLTLSASAATGFNQTLFEHSFSQLDKGAFPSQDPAKINGTSYAATPADFSRNALVYNNVNAKPNGLFSLTAGNRFLKNKRLGIMFSGSYQNTRKSSDYIFFKPSAQADVNNVAQFTDLELFRYDKQQIRTGLHTHADYQFNSRNSVTLNAMYLQMNEYETRTVIDTTININRTGAGTGPVDLTWRSAVRKQNIASVSLSGKHALTNRLTADWTVAYNVAKRNVPGLAELHNSFNISNNLEQINSVKYSWENTKDQDQEGYLNLTYVTPVAGRDLEIKAGGMYRHKDRDNYFNQYELTGLGGAAYHSILTDTLKLSSDPHGEAMNTLTYTITENISAGYVQGKIMLGDRLQALAGVRVEHTYQHYAVAQDPNVFVGQNGTFNYTDVLPGIHLKYSLNEKTNLRLSYFKSISRPAFFEIVPFTKTISEEFDEMGNPYLKHAQANNFDARYEWFSHGNDQLLIGAFYKQILNPIEYSLQNVGGPSNLDLVVTNPTDASGGSSTAYNYGFELQATKFFHSFGVSANYTYTHSQIAGTVVNYHRDASGSLVKDLVTEKRPMQGQAAHIGNLALIYKGQKTGLDAQVALAYTGPQIAFLSNFEGLNYWQKGIAMLDCSLEKKITRHISFYAKVNNILNTPTIYELRTDKERFVSTAPGNYYQLPYQTLPNSVLVEKALFGRNYLAGIRFKLN